jgi:hypothetical protein
MIPLSDRPVGPVTSAGGTAMQTAQPRDIGLLLLVVGLFLILFVVAVVVPGSQVR